MQPPNASSAETPEEARVTRATLWTGFFTNGVWDMLSVLVPLYGAAVGLSTADIGFVVAARSVLPAALSIHGGIVMDHWGTRRVIVWLAAACFVLPLMYPVSGWLPLLLALQLILGLASSLGMAAAQTWSLQSSHDVATLARFSLYSRIGTFLGPVMVGAVWDFLGAWAAFACISLWGGCIVAAAGIAGSADRPAHTTAPSQGPRTLAVLIPQWSAHRQALAMAAIPAVALVLAISFLRNAPGAIQASMYVVYLGNIGFSGTLIGALVGICELFGVAGTMIAAPLERRLRRPHALVVGCITASVIAISVTPLVGHILPLLIVAAGVRGMAQGMSQPLMYSLLGRAVPRGTQGASVGLRSAVTRFASIVTPAVMGVAAEAWGIEVSFYVMGALLLSATFVLGAVARHERRGAPAARDGDAP